MKKITAVFCLVSILMSATASANESFLVCNKKGEPITVILSSSHLSFRSEQNMTSNKSYLIKVSKTMDDALLEDAARSFSLSLKTGLILVTENNEHVVQILKSTQGEVLIEMANRIILRQAYCK